MAKVYLVWCNEDNLAEYEDNCIENYVLDVFSTSQKAKEFIKDWAPYLGEVLGKKDVMTDNLSKIKALCQFVEYSPDAERAIYVYNEEGTIGRLHRALYELTIEEREVK